MRKKVLIRPVSMMVSMEMFDQLTRITDQREISTSDYIRGAVQEKMRNEDTKKINDQKED